MVDHGIGRTDEEARTARMLANALADALVSAVERGRDALRTVTFDAPGCGGHQTWTDAGVSECPDCLRTRVCFASPADAALVAHFCLTCGELVLERDGARAAWTSRRLAKVLHDTPLGTSGTRLRLVLARAPIATASRRSPFPARGRGPG